MRASCVQHRTWAGWFMEARESMHSSALHATETHVRATSWTDESSDLVQLSMHCYCRQHSALQKIVQRRSAVHSKFTNCKFYQILGVRIWKFHNICNRTHTFRLCGNLETQNLTKNWGIRRFALTTTYWLISLLEGWLPILQAMEHTCKLVGFSKKALPHICMPQDY